MRCPKETEVELSTGLLTEGLEAKCCPSCEGNWLPKFNYQRWQADNAGLDAVPAEVVPLKYESEFVTAPLDGRAGLCPECGAYLKRARVNLKHSSFYIERCPICAGLWCDKGEWAVFTALGLHVQIPVVFNPEWQSRVRVMEQIERQRLAVVEKVGPDIARQVFELSEKLQEHPHGDFAVAYLMRQFNR